MCVSQTNIITYKYIYRASSHAVDIQELLSSNSNAKPSLSNILDTNTMARNMKLVYNKDRPRRMIFPVVKHPSKISMLNLTKTFSSPPEIEKQSYVKLKQGIHCHSSPNVLKETQIVNTRSLSNSIESNIQPSKLRITVPSKASNNNNNLNVPNGNLYIPAKFPVHSNTNTNTEDLLINTVSSSFDSNINNNNTLNVPGKIIRIPSASTNPPSTNLSNGKSVVNALLNYSPSPNCVNRDELDELSLSMDEDMYDLTTYTGRIKNAGKHSKFYDSYLAIIDNQTKWKDKWFSAKNIIKWLRPHYEKMLIDELGKYSTGYSKVKSNTPNKRKVIGVTWRVLPSVDVYHSNYYGSDTDEDVYNIPCAGNTNDSNKPGIIFDINVAGNDDNNDTIIDIPPLPHGMSYNDDDDDNISVLSDDGKQESPKLTKTEELILKQDLNLMSKVAKNLEQKGKYT